MKKAALFVLLGLVVIGIGVLFVCTRSKPEPTFTPVVSGDIPAATPTVQELFAITNEERKAFGATPVTLDERLNQSAQAKAEDMNKNNYFDHVNPITKKRGNTYIKELAPECLSGTENLTKNREDSNTSARAVHSWMSSTEHRKALLDSRYDKVGFGVSGLYVVQHFCDLS